MPEEQPVISTVFTVIISSAKAKVPEGIAGGTNAGNCCSVTVCIRGLLFLQQLLNGAADTFDIAGPEALMRAAQGALAVNQVRGGHATQIVGLRGVASGIVKGWVGHRKFLQKGQPVGRFIIQIDGENFKIGNPLLAQLSAQGVQQGQGGTAGAAPGCPE